MGAGQQIKFMSQDRVTSIDVAKEAGVSQSAVSRVFSQTGSASQKTIEKVQKAADKLGYRPNILARSLITGKSRIIGLLVAYLENYFYPEAVEILSRQLQKQGYHVLIFLASSKEGNLDTIVQELLDYQVDGIITASVSMSSDLTKSCQSAGIPVVMFNRIDDNKIAHSVTADNFQGGYEAARYFIETGHQKISYIAGWEGASTQRDREAGFVKALSESNIKLHSRAIGDYDQDKAKQAARELCDTDDRPDAIFVANDHMAFAVMDVIRFELGLSIPDDIAIIGFDDVPPAAWPAYNLTTLRQPANQMVEATINTLISQIEEPQSDRNTFILPSPLIIRATTRPHKK